MNKVKSSDQFNIPIVLFIFKRMKAVEVIKQISHIAPRTLYLIGDGPRNEEEREHVNICRKAVEKAITWECNVIKNYAEKNRGVCENIGGGAKWVFSQTKTAIFLEDDNLPELSFFRFCKEMLDKYEDEEKVLWVCGTNYLGEYQSNDSYAFTQHLLPCGWASWSKKFLKYYDIKLECIKNDSNFDKKIKNRYNNRGLYHQYKRCWLSEYKKIQKGKQPASWDYQMDFSIKYHNLLGICPNKNQIKNIGVDNDSIHGGNSWDNVMTQRFCGMNSYPLNFPLTHPKNITVDKKLEKKIAKILLHPLKIRIRMRLGDLLRSFFGLDQETSLTQLIKNKFLGLYGTKHKDL